MPKPKGAISHASTRDERSVLAAVKEMLSHRSSDTAGKEEPAERPFGSATYRMQSVWFVASR